MYVTRTRMFLDSRKRKFQLPKLRPIKQANEIKFLTMPQGVNRHGLFAEKLNIHVIHKAMSRVTERNELGRLEFRDFTAQYKVLSSKL